MMSKKKIIFSLILVSLIGILAFNLKNNRSTYINKDFNIIKSEKRENGTYIKTRNDITKTGKEIFIDKQGNIYSDDYIE